jgi:hypothetical protein
MQIYIESPVSIIMAGSQKEECRKFYELDSLRKVDEVAKSLKQYRGESSKEYFRSLAVKYFIGVSQCQGQATGEAASCR